MKVYIANPLYDAVFKRIMEEERITKTFLSAILQREVVSIKICQDGFRNIKSNSISIFKMGFVASIKNNEDRLIFLLNTSYPNLFIKPILILNVKYA